MSLSDPVADMLTRIRNAVAVRHNFVTMPSSRMRQAIAEVLKTEGFVSHYEVTREGAFPTLKIYLKYTEKRESVLQGIERVSKPGCRIYAKKAEIPYVRSGMGTVILSTPRGVLSGREAGKQGVGGEILCKVW
ncbi:MAG: 30S ribosomal protein S8 [Chloroflexi bacterium]|nr:30S ribosomal protein S8 [Chloroflexota bacterium]